MQLAHDGRIILYLDDEAEEVTFSAKKIFHHFF